MAHSLLLGGSIASRRMKCSASFQEQLKLPPSTAVSVYAETGTALHEAIAELLVTGNDPSDVIGRTFNNYVVTETDVETLLVPALDALEQLEQIYGDDFKLVALEKHVELKWLPDAFGTVDVVLQSKTHTLIADHKFGSGVAVEIGTADDLNAQALFYASGARHLMRDRQLVIAIIQPAFTPALLHARVSTAQLDAFEHALREAVAANLRPNPSYARGEWCRFAPCKVTCPLWTGALLDLTALGRPAKPHPKLNGAGALAYADYLSKAKRLVDEIMTWRTAVEDAVIDFIRQGGTVPGYALRLAPKNRKWLADVDKVAAELRDLGIKDEQIWKRSLNTFQILDAAARKLGVKIPDELRPRPPSTDFAIVREGDPAAVDVKVLTQEFSANLKQLLEMSQ